MAAFHLSLPVPAVTLSADFFVRVLGATVVHADASGYVNLDLAGVQLTLTAASETFGATPDFHFGINLDAAGFHALEERARTLAPECIEEPARLVDADTPRERYKLYVRCPAGYRIEIKGLRAA